MYASTPCPTVSHYQSIMWRREDELDMSNSWEERAVGGVPREEEEPSIETCQEQKKDQRA